jgi:hypothetical protein
MIVRATSKYPESSSRTSSGSLDSLNGVKPTRSQNNTEHTRRSATGARTVGAGAADGRAASDLTVVNAVPQARQKRLPGVVAAPHEGQRTISGEPHSSQNALTSSFAAPHDWHTGMAAA